MPDPTVESKSGRAQDRINARNALEWSEFGGINGTRIRRKQDVVFRETPTTVQEVEVVHWQSHRISKLVAQWWQGWQFACNLDTIRLQRRLTFESAIHPRLQHLTNFDSI
ncbi:MAG: hypothetical protein AAFV88_03935 [Planctomycetota bacterium]